MKRLRIILGSILIVLLVFLALYGKDNYYLKLKSADRIWSEIYSVLNEIAKKGDHVEYENSNSLHEERLKQHIEMFNQKNAPHVMNTYVLNTKFSELDGNNVVEFSITEKSTNQIMEQKLLQAEQIKAKSIIPGFIAFFGSLITLNPVACLLTGIWVGATINAANSFTMGLHDLIFKYIPYGFKGIKLAIFFYLILLCIRVMNKAGALRTIAEEKSPLKYIPLIFTAYHPYIFSSFGNWYFKAINKDRPSHNTESTFQTIGLAIQPLLIFSPLMFFYIQGNSIYFHFTSLALLTVSFLYILWSKKAVRHILYSESDPDLKKIKMIPYAVIIASILPIPLIFLGFRLNNVLLISGLSAILPAIYYSTKHGILSLKDICKLAFNTLKYSLKFMVYVVLAYSLEKVLRDTGAIHFMISFFITDIQSPLFFMLLFVSSIISSSIMGGFVASSYLLLTSFTPLIGLDLGSIDMSAVSICILEGALIGELLCPYSPSSIISSALFGVNPSSHVLKQIKYVMMATFIAAVLGFLLYGLGVAPTYCYVGILLLSIGSVAIMKKYKKL